MKLEIHYADEWAALYKDGVLVDRSVGDSYIAEEQAFGLLGVKLVRDDAFLRGQSQRAGVAMNLNEVKAYREQRDGRRLSAAKLREEAERLIEEAEAIDPR